jgi:hypothetical protein
MVSSSAVGFDEVRVVQSTNVNNDSNNKEVSRFIGPSFARETDIYGRARHHYLMSRIWQMYGIEGATDDVGIAAA